MRALVHVQYTLKGNGNIDVHPTDLLLSTLSLLTSWNLYTNNNDTRSIDEIHSQTYVLLSRIPPRDRGLAIAAYASTLYHGPTKSWCLVSLPNIGIADFRIFNPDSEALKKACSALVQDLLAVAQSGAPAGVRDPDPEFRKNVHAHPEIIEQLVTIRTEYEQKRDTIAARTANPESAILFRGQYPEHASQPEPPSANPSQSTQRDNTGKTESIKQSTHQEAMQHLMLRFPSSITILQPDVPELAFEGAVISGLKFVYSFKMHRPTSIVSLVAIMMGTLFMFLPWTNGERMGRLATAFLATGLVRFATVFTSWIQLQCSKRGAVIDWQALDKYPIIG